jgi:hypothetical protein
MDRYARLPVWVLKEATISPKNFGAGIPGEHFKRLGAVHDGRVGDSCIAENEGNGTVDVADVHDWIGTSADSDLGAARL